MNLENYLTGSIAAALKAGDAILEVYNTEFTVEQKSDKSPLTLADKRAHDIISGQLSGYDLPLLSEEGKHIPYLERKKWDTFWLIDPLDGTKEFVKRNGEFTVNIALIQKDRPILGVIFIPVKHTLYFAATGVGSFKCDSKPLDTAQNLLLKNILSDASSLPIISRKDTHASSYTIVGSRSHATPELEAFVDEKRKSFEHVDFISAGSSLKFCLVAEGKADIYPRLGPTMEWDTAAGQAIAENSGVQVVRHDIDAPLTYNKENLLNPYFIVKRTL